MSSLTTELPITYTRPYWYAFQTSAHHEKVIASQCEHRGIEYFLPLYQTIHRWKDRRKKVELPLFPGYIFVRLPLRDRLKVLQLRGVSHLVGFGGQIPNLPDREIEALRAGLSKVPAAPHPYLKVGRRVRVRSGPFEGLEGILIGKDGDTRMVVSVDLIMRSMILDIDGAELEMIATTS